MTRPLRYVYARVVKKIRGAAIANSSIDPTAKVESGCTMVDSTMDRHSFSGYDCDILTTDIGAFCSIASNVRIGLGGRHPLDFVSTSPAFLSHEDSIKAKFARHDVPFDDRTTVGSDVWIGDGVFVKAGVTIGHGAVIGMGSIVTSDVAAYSISAGNPARHIRFRFDPSVCDALLASEWWTWDDAKLRSSGTSMNDPEAFLRAAGHL